MTNFTQQNSLTHALKAARLNKTQLFSALCGLGLSVAVLIGSANGVTAATISELLLPQVPGYAAAYTMNVDGNRDVGVFWEDIGTGTEFCLSLTENVSWWKGLKIFNENNSLLGFIARTDDARSRQCDSFTASELSAGDGIAKVELWKAKAFGVHTHIDTLEFDPADVEGKRVSFYWISE